MAHSHSPAPSSYSDCVASLRTSLTLLESSVDTLGSGVADLPRLGSVLKTVRVRVEFLSLPLSLSISPPQPPSPFIKQHNLTPHSPTPQHYELLPQPTLAAAEASLRDEIGPFVAHLLDRADRQVERQARRLETLKARSELNAGRLNNNNSNNNNDIDNEQQESAGRASSSRGRAGGGASSSSRKKTLDGGAGLRARAVRQRREALQYGVERLEMEVAQKERELRTRLQGAA